MVATVRSRSAEAGNEGRDVGVDGAAGASEDGCDGEEEEDGDGLGTRMFWKVFAGVISASLRRCVS